MDRLDKLVADRVCISRKEVKALLRSGKVLVNGRLVTASDYKCAPKDQVTVAGKPLNLSPLITIMLHKPAGVLCTTADKRCDTVMDLLPDTLRRKGLFPAGRLDKDTTGLVLITDDGGFAHQMLAPKSHVPKRYHVRLDGPIDFNEVRDTFGEGMSLGGGDFSSPARLKMLEEVGETPLLELTIYEGIYHQVKRMFDRFRRDVVSLKRVQMGGLALDESLSPGECRVLTPEELDAVFRE